MYIMLTIKQEDTMDYLTHLECLSKVTEDDICSYDSGYNDITIDQLTQQDITNIVAYSISLNKQCDLWVWNKKGGEIVTTFCHK